MSLLLYTTESCTSEDNISGIQFDNQFTTVHIYQHQTVYHFEEQSDSSDKVLFSSYRHISVSKGISSNSLSNAELIAGDHIEFRGITDFCQNGTHIIVVDKWNHCIRAINYDNGHGNNLTSTLAGKCDGYDNGYTDGDASSALFNRPHSILITKSGNTFLYLVTDTGNNAIRLIDADKGEVTTFVRSSRHLNEPIDLIFSQNLSSLYVTTRSGLTMVDIQTRQMSLIQGSSNFGRLYKMAWLTNNTYLISDKLGDKLIVLTTSGQNFSFEPICCRVTESGEKSVSNCRLNQPSSVFFSREKCAIIVGAYQRIHQVNVHGNICNNTNSISEVPKWILTTTTSTTATTTTTTTTTSTSTTSSATSSTTSSATNSTTSSATNSATSSTASPTTNSTTSSTTSPTTSSTTSTISITRDIATETRNAAEIVASKEFDERYGPHQFLIYGLVALVTIILLVTSAMMYRAFRTVSNSMRCMHVSEQDTTRSLPVRPPEAPSINPYDQIPLRNSGLSSEFGTHTNHLHSMSNGSPQLPIRTNRRNADGYAPMHANPESVYTRMNNAVYQNIQPEGIRLLPTEPVTSETEMYTDDVYSQRQ